MPPKKGKNDMKTRIKIKPEYFSGNRKSWFKLVSDVDTEKTNGYAFNGDFIEINKETDVEIGSIIIECRPSGSVKNWGKKGIIHKVIENDIEEISHEYDYMKDFLSFRDAVAAELDSGDDMETLKIEREKLVARIAEIDAILKGDANDIQN